MDSTAICAALYRHAREHNGRNLEIELNGVPVLLVQRREDADHVLRHAADNYRKNMAWFRQALGASRFSEDGPAWEVRRRLTQDYFVHFDRERTTALARRHAATALARLLADGAAGQARLDDGVLRRMAVSVLVENFFEHPFEDLDVDLERIAELMDCGSAYSFVPAGHTGAMYRDTLRRLPPLRRRVLEDLRGFRDGRVPATPLLAGMLAADRDPATGVVLEHELLTFFAAGAETSAATVGWALYLLARHPEAQARLREQALALAPAIAAGGWPALSGFQMLATLVSETLRMFPPTPIIARLAVQPDRIGAHAVQAGQNVLVSFVGIGHDERYRADPWRLDLDGAACRGPAAGTHVAFSFGPRVCGGKQFALVELMAFLHALLLGARYEADPAVALAFHWKSQMLHAGGQPVRVLPN